jgi:hypothetical protein
MTWKKQKADPVTYVHPHGYWCDPLRNIRRLGGGERVVLSATKDCSDEEWKRICDALAAAQFLIEPAISGDTKIERLKFELDSLL